MRGINQARRGWLEANDVVNAFPFDDLKRAYVDLAKVNDMNGNFPFPGPLILFMRTPIYSFALCLPATLVFRCVSAGFWLLFT